MARRNNEERNRPVEDTGGAAALAEQQQVTTNNSGNLSFVVPTEFVELPSRGIFYPENHPLYKQETIEIKHMTAKEEDILTSRALLKKGIAIDRLLQSIIINKNIRPHEMLVGDKNAVMIAARISGYGPDYNTRITCPNCSTVNEPEIDLLEVQSAKLGITSDGIEGVEGPTEVGTFLITLPITKATVEVKLMSGADEKKFSERVQSRKKNRQAEAMLTDQFKTFIVSINGNRVAHKLFTAIDNLPVRDSRFLRSTYNQLSPSVDLRHDFTCESCGYEQEVEVPITAQFFWPDA
tara:strand:+ start:3027 stop:3908 length:882 start_codon:yes stop_codon:yes gene_type:complete